MTIKDTIIFGKPGSGGSSVRKYDSGIIAEHLDEVRSRVDSNVYIRHTSSPTSLTMTKDPALDADNFVIEDTTSPLGTIKTFADNGPTGLTGLKWTNGQGWLRNGSYVLQSQVTRPLPSHLINSMAVQFVQPASNGFPAVTLSELIVSVETNDAGVWMVLTQPSGNGTAYKLYVSTDDAVTWTQPSSITAYGASNSFLPSIATDKAGTWWIATGDTNKILKSVNNGTTWTASALQPGSGLYPNVFKCVNGKLYFASNTSVMFSSSNSANTSAVVFYRCDDPYAGTLTWTTVTHNPYNVSTRALGVAADTTATVVDLEPTPSGKVWVVWAAAVNNCAIGLFEPTNSTFTYSKNIRFDKNTGNRIGYFGVIGLHLAGESVRILTLNSQSSTMDVSLLHQNMTSEVLCNLQLPSAYSSFQSMSYIARTRLFQWDNGHVIVNFSFTWYNGSTHTPTTISSLFIGNASAGAIYGNKENPAGTYTTYTHYKKSATGTALMFADNTYYGYRYSKPCVSFHPSNGVDSTLNPNYRVPVSQYMRVQ